MRKRRNGTVEGLKGGRRGQRNGARKIRVVERKGGNGQDFGSVKREECERVGGGKEGEFGKAERDENVGDWVLVGGKRRKGKEREEKRRG